MRKRLPGSTFCSRAIIRLRSTCMASSSSQVIAAFGLTMTISGPSGSLRRASMASQTLSAAKYCDSM